MTLPAWMQRIFQALKSQRIPIVLTLGSCIVGLVLAEFVAGFVVARPSNYPAFWGRSVPLAEYAPNHDYRFTLGTKRRPAPPGGYRVRTEQHGFIIGPGDVGHTGRHADIVFLGGSTTENMFVGESLRFPYRVGQLLQSADGSSVYTLNGGVSATNARDTFNILMAKVIPMKPGYIVLMHNLNDLGLLTGAGSYWRDLSLCPMIKGGGAAPGRLKGLLAGLTHRLFPHLTELVSRVRSPTSAQPDRLAASHCKLLHWNTATDFAAMNRSMVRTIRAWGMEPVLMTEFNNIKPGNRAAQAFYESRRHTLSWPQFIEEASAFNQATRQVAAEEHVLLIDLDAKMQDKGEVSYDMFHLNEAGNRAAADIIAAALVRAYPKRFMFKPALAGAANPASTPR